MLAGRSGLPQLFSCVRLLSAHCAEAPSSLRAASAVCHRGSTLNAGSVRLVQNGARSCTEHTNVTASEWRWESDCFSLPNIYLTYNITYPRAFTLSSVTQVNMFLVNCDVLFEATNNDVMLLYFTLL